jgi:hypothetical protein
MQTSCAAGIWRGRETDRMQSRYKDQAPEETDGRYPGQSFHPHVRMALVLDSAAKVYQLESTPTN